MRIKHLRTIALAGTLVLGTTGLGFAAGSGSGSGSGSGAGSAPGNGMGSGSSSSNSTMSGTRNSTGATGLENAEGRGSTTGKMNKQKGTAFNREDSNTSERNELNTKK